MLAAQLLVITHPLCGDSIPDESAIVLSEVESAGEPQIIQCSAKCLYGLLS